MKKSNYKLIVLGSILFLTMAYSCKKILDKSPAGVLAGPTLANKAGVDGLLIGAYSMLDGYYQGQPGSAFASGISNWTWGGVGSDDAYKGSSTGDQRDEGLTAIEQHISINPTDSYLYSKWQVNYAGIVRANNVIQEIPLVKDGSLTDAAAKIAIAEARFLRGVYHFELAKIWQNVPYVDETVTYAAGNLSVGNPAPIWDKIEADFQAAMDGLPATQPQAGRANKYAAEAFLAKALIFDHKYDLALPKLTDCINNGTTASGAKYALEPYANNFNASTKNGPESVFAAQMTVNDGSNGQNDDAGDVLNFPGGGTYSSCCGFYTPSYHLANAFKVDANGLPMFQIDPATGFPTYDDVNLGNDHGVGPTTAYTPTAEAIDSRLDWTVGRRGIPYLDWGLGGGEPWTRGDLVPYVPIKNVFYHAAQATTTDTQAGWAGSQGVANNYNIIRFADILLWRAECYILGTTPNLALAEADVNTVRARAALPSNWVKTYVDNADPSKGFTNIPAANYKVGLYTGQFAANGQAYALGALMVERQLEFGMEGHRFFDLQRMDGRFGGKLGAGYMTGVMNAYYKADNRIANPTLGAAKFTTGRDEVYPIPQSQIDIEGGKLKQNTNY
ncbi:MAG: SusD family protein [Mucilaginibacter sp.]|nr:SusD family protein [Mucilaginibacter sp.]